MATSYQIRPGGFLDPVLRMPPKGAKVGLVLTITSQDYIIHWPGSVPEDSSTRLVDTMTTAILPYQEGDSICDLEASTKVISNSEVWKLTPITEQFTHGKYSWFAVLGHHWSPQKRPMSGHQMNQNPTYHPLPRATMVKPRIRNKLEKEKTS